MSKETRKYPIAIGIALGIFFIVYYALPKYLVLTFKPINKDLLRPKIQKVVHVPTPNVVKGVYMTACYASAPSLRNQVIKLIDETELNTIVIDIKDYTGKISYKTENPLLKDAYSKSCPVKDMKELIQSLHEKNIYVIGRVTVFQDLHMAEKYPEIAVKTNSDKNKVWPDRKGLKYIDPGSEVMSKYILALANNSYALGFDEINFDYIRFPSDGNMKDIYFPFSQNKIDNNPELGRAEVMRGFYSYLGGKLKEKNIPSSADLFGMTTINEGDSGIGQILEYAAPYFDYISPMVYPSHFAKGFYGYKDVNKYPYELVKLAMDKGVVRLNTANIPLSKMRPWLQDNNYPITYTATMVRAQIKATYDAGLTSWMLWDAGNTYTRGALLSK